MNLMGVDVGFSKSRRTTGIACLDADKFYVTRAGTPRESRMAQIPTGFQADVIAIDGPLLPQGTDEAVRRQCESIFIGGPFSRRCKPGLSDFGFGLKLRRAAKTACEEFSQFLSPGGRIIEAFPNAFLAVVVSAKEFSSASNPRRRRRFDWLYELAVRTENLKSTLSQAVDLPDSVWDRIETEKDHEKRAALVCLLTAALVDKGTAHKVGDVEGGWFWLPPLSLWQSWASDGLSAALGRSLRKLALPQTGQT
jgi:predicted nuclease with RNAse H fold